MCCLKKGRQDFTTRQNIRLHKYCLRGLQVVLKVCWPETEMAVFIKVKWTSRPAGTKTVEHVCPHWTNTRITRLSFRLTCVFTQKGPKDRHVLFFQEWYNSRVRGCFFLEADGSISSLQYQLHVPQTTNVYLTIQPLSLSHRPGTGTLLLLKWKIHEVDFCLCLLRSATRFPLVFQINRLHGWRWTRLFLSCQPLKLKRTQP